MKLAELMNDDTCQILLAIIIGIVVCYFIFGSCGSCSTGSCNRDGFSVGGQSCTGQIRDDAQFRSCDRARDRTGCEMSGCIWNPAPPPTSGNIGCRVIGQNGIPYLTELTNQCQLGENTDGTLGQGATAIDNYNLDGSIDPSFRYSQRCCDLVQNIPPDCRADGTELDTISGPDSVSLRNDLSTINTHFCTQPDTPPNRYFNILGDMISAIQTLSTTLTDTETATLNGIQEQRTNDPQNSSTLVNFESVRAIASAKGIFFHICMNDSNVYTGDSILGRNLTYFDDSNIIWRNRRTPVPLVFGDLFGTFAVSPIEVKKNIYCSENEITINDTTNPNGTPVQKYDPLLKLKSPNMANDGYVNCSGGDGALFPSSCDGSDTRPNRECDFSIMYDSVRSRTSDKILNELVHDKQSYRSRILRLYETWYGSSAANPMTIPMRNKREIYIEDRNLYERDSEPLSKFTGPDSQYISLKINTVASDYTSSYEFAAVNFPNRVSSRLKFNALDGKASDTGADGLTLEIDDDITSFKKLELVYGMSQPSNGQIYNSVSDTPTPDTNKYNFFKNLMFVQYLLTRMFLIGTEKYVPHELNIYNKKPEFPLQSADMREDVLTANLNNEINTMCTDSGKNYLLLVFKNAHTNLSPPAQPPPNLECRSRNYLFDTNQGCEWLIPAEGTQCSDYVTDTDGVLGPGGYFCENGPQTGLGPERAGHGHCNNGLVCTGQLPTTTKGKNK